MRIKAHAACEDMKDGSVQVIIYSTRAEALEQLDRTEEQLSSGDTCFYEDGVIIPVDIDIELSKDGKKAFLKSPINLGSIE